MTVIYYALFGFIALWFIGGAWVTLDDYARDRMTRIINS
jgi:hypothetical protein